MIALNNSVSVPIQYLFALQGLRIMFTDASRLIFRLSASSHVRATLRIYAESYEKDPSKHEKEPQVNREKLQLHFQGKDILYISDPNLCGLAALLGGRKVACICKCASLSTFI